MAGLPKHFSMISAQRGPSHDQKAHLALKTDLEAAGYKTQETEGHYNHPEKSFMVEHQGRPEDHAAIDSLGRKYQQESVLHSSFKAHQGSSGTHHNELRFMDGRPSVHGKGHRVDAAATDYFTHHPGVGKFQMHLDFGGADAAKALTPQKPAAAPKVQPTEPTASDKPKLTIAQKAAIAKSKQELRKQAFAHQDGETLVDPRSHVAAAGPVPKSLMDWGAERLVPMKIDDYREIPLSGHIIKVTKKSPDLYSGWVEREANIGHKFEKITMPQLLMQLQSALELYGREDQVVQEAEVKIPVSEFLDEHKKLVAVLESPSKQDDAEQLKEQRRELTEVGQAVSEAIDETKDANEADRQAKIREKLESLCSKVKSEEIPIKDLEEGLQNPEHECPACEAPSEDCSCYEGLSSPTVEIDLKAGKLKIMFKSDWNPEDKDNFKEDLKRRAGIVLKKRQEARAEALGKARRLIDVVKRTKK